MSRRSRSQEDPPADAAATHHPRSVSKPEMEKAGLSTPADSKHHPELKTYQESSGDDANEVANDRITLQRRKERPPTNPTTSQSTNLALEVRSQTHGSQRFSDVQHLLKLSTDQVNDGGNNADLVGTACSTLPDEIPPPRVPTWSSTQSALEGGGLASVKYRKQTW